MDDPLVVVTVRIPKSVAERAKYLAGSQERTVQSVYARALRFGMNRLEEHDRIAWAAIKAADHARQPSFAPAQPHDVTGMEASQ